MSMKEGTRAMKKTSENGGTGSGQKDGLIKQAAMRKKSPLNEDPANLLYLCLVPDAQTGSFSLRYHEARVGIESCSDGRFSLSSALEPEPTQGEPVDFGITEDSYVVIELSDQFAWRYSQQFAGIVLKNKADTKFYGKLEYSQTLEGPYFRKKKFPKGESVRFLRFVAKLNTGTKGESARHPYCLNMEFKMDGARNEWVPMTLDPDMTNPHT